MRQESRKSFCILALFFQAGDSPAAAEAPQISFRGLAGLQQAHATFALRILLKTGRRQKSIKSALSVEEKRKKSIEERLRHNIRGNRRHPPVSTDAARGKMDGEETAVHEIRKE